MDPQVSTSFIPKKNLETASARSSGGGGLILLISIFIFIASIVAAGAVFAYEQVLTQSLKSKSDSLAANQKAYDPGVIEELLRMDTRITEAKKLLDKHLAPSAIFALLSQQTLEKVQFLSYDFTPNPDGSSKILLTGIADSFSTVALQSDQLGASKVLKDVAFSGVTIDSKTGRVTFAVTASVDASITAYANALTANPTVPNTTDTAPVQETTTPPVETPSDDSSSTQ
jgi:hypothetical protein